MDFTARFEALDVLNKARVIAAVCAVCGVLMGFIIYIVFAHTFEQGEIPTRLVALALELALVGSLGFWLTIALLAVWSLRRRQEGMNLEVVSDPAKASAHA